MDERRSRRCREEERSRSRRDLHSRFVSSTSLVGAELHRLRQAGRGIRYWQTRSIGCGSEWPATLKRLRKGPGEQWAHDVNGRKFFYVFAQLWRKAIVDLMPIIDWASCSIRYRIGVDLIESKLVMRGAAAPSDCGGAWLQLSQGRYGLFPTDP
jgi:hypothetical protein